MGGETGTPERAKRRRKQQEIKSLLKETRRKSGLLESTGHQTRDHAPQRWKSFSPLTTYVGRISEGQFAMASI